MSKITITYKEVLQDSQECGSNDEHMVSRVKFDLELEGQIYPDCTVDVKQTVGSDYDSAALEVSNLNGYEGPNDWSKFRFNTEILYRSLIGVNGSVVNTGSGSGEIRMRDNIISCDRTFEYIIDSSHSVGGGW